MDIEFDNTEEEIKKLDDKIKYAEENFGDTEVREAIMNKAEYYYKINNNEMSKKTYLQAYDKTVGVSKRLEVIMCLLKMNFKEKNTLEMKQYIDKSVKLLEEGGDWESKNKLKVQTFCY